jgi:putative membrane protein
VLLFLLLLQALAVLWAFATLQGFRIVRRGEDLRTTCGFFTRQTAALPRSRIQYLLVRETWLHRLTGRVSIKVLTAGGDSTRASQVARKWLVPMARRRDLARILGQVQPELDLALLGRGERDWRAVHPRARRRLFLRRLGALALPLALLALRSPLAALVALPPVVGLAYLLAALRARRLGWCVGERAVYLRDGLVGRRTACVRFAKVQSVALAQTPFDRRAGMARVRVDTAGAGDHELSFVVPYLGLRAALGLRRRLEHEAARSAFRW